jgi:hypothetical protein
LRRKRPRFCPGTFRSLSISGFVHPHLSAAIRARWNSEIEAVVLSNLAGICAGARTDGRGNFGDALVAVGIDLLINKKSE